MLSFALRTLRAPRDEYGAVLAYSVPDVDGRSLDRLLCRDIDHDEVERERGARAIFDDVAAHEIQIEVVRTFGHLGRENHRAARGGGGGRGGRRGGRCRGRGARGG